MSRQRGMLASATVAAVGCLMAPAVAPARPADVVVTNEPTVRLTEEANTVKLDPRANVVQVRTSTVTAVVEHQSLSSGPNVCTSLQFPLPVGQPLMLDTVTVDMSGVRASNEPRAGIRLARKTEDGTTLQSIDLSIPMDGESGFSTASGTGRFGIPVEPSSFSDAAPGDIYAVSTCVNRGSASGGTALALLTGTKATG